MYHHSCKVRRLLAGVFGAVFFLASSAQQVHAAVSQTSALNSASIGHVDIEFSDLPTSLTADDGSNIVLPGQPVSYPVSIENKGEEAWVRAKVTLRADESGKITELPGEIVQTDDNSDDQLKKIGEYYYYQKPLQTNQTVSFIKELAIPGEWDNASSGGSFSVSVTAEAVQYRNFTPDFTSDDPWFGTVIETMNTKASDGKAAESDKAFSVIYQNGAEGLVKTDDNFFSNWGTLMPGDEVSDSVTVGNRYAVPVEIYFQINKAGEDQDGLYKKIRLVITDGSSTIFDGTLADAMDPVSLGVFKNGDTSSLQYKLTVPSELDNSAALRRLESQWVFSAELKEEDQPSNDNKGGENNGGNGSSESHHHHHGGTSENSSSDGTPVQPSQSGTAQNGVQQAVASAAHPASGASGSGNLSANRGVSSAVQTARRVLTGDSSHMLLAGVIAAGAAVCLVIWIRSRRTHNEQ